MTPSEDRSTTPSEDRSTTQSDDGSTTPTDDGSTTQSDEGPTVMIALSNPRTEAALVAVAGALAEHRSGRLLAVHVVTVPDQTSLEKAAANREKLDRSSADLLAAAVDDAEGFDAPVETRTVLSHRGIEEVFDAARTNDADAVVMGYGGARFAGGRVEGSLDEIARDLPCDFLVLDGQPLDPADVLVPTAGGPSSDLSAEAALALRDAVGASVSLLHVVDEGDEASGREFLADWAEGHGLADADLRVEAGDVGAAIERVGAGYDLVVVGATERGLLSRVVRGSPASAAIERLAAPVLLAERPASRSLRERLFGGR